VENYFGTGSRAPEPREVTPVQDDDDLDFWGGQSPRRDADKDDSEDQSSSSDGDAMDEDETEEEDAMDIFGHR
jgi:hypothetical protein